MSFPDERSPQEASMPIERSHSTIPSDGDIPSDQPFGPMPTALSGTKIWASEALFGDAAEVLIAHDGQLYRLRRTHNGKWILCK